MVKHRKDGEEWWCLPGGAVEARETPAKAAVRELKEECGVVGTIVTEVSHITYPPAAESYTFLIDIGHQTPHLGDDPDTIGPFLVDMQWLRLKDIPERDRAFLWWSGLLSVPQFFSEIEKWGDSISHPAHESQED